MSTNNLRALIVEDNPSDQLVLAAQLKNIFIYSDVAENTEQALSKLRTEKYDILFVDLQLARESGIDLIKRIKSPPLAIMAPVMVVSSRREMNDVKAAIAVGARDYIVKPIDGLILESKIATFFNWTDRSSGWYEYSIPASDNNRIGAIVKSAELMSISENSLSVRVEENFMQGEVISMNIPLLKTLSITKNDFRVQSCVKEDVGFVLSLTFVGLNADEQKSIRTFCKKLAPINRGGTYADNSKDSGA